MNPNHEAKGEFSSGKGGGVAGAAAQVIGGGKGGKMAARRAVGQKALLAQHPSLAHDAAAQSQAAAGHEAFHAGVARPSLNDKSAAWHAGYSHAADKAGIQPNAGETPAAAAGRSGKSFEVVGKAKALTPKQAAKAQLNDHAKAANDASMAAIKNDSIVTRKAAVKAHMAAADAHEQSGDKAGAAFYRQQAGVHQAKVDAVVKANGMEKAMEEAPRMAALNSQMKAEHAYKAGGSKPAVKHLGDMGMHASGSTAPSDLNVKYANGQAPNAQIATNEASRTGNPLDHRFAAKKHREAIGGHTAIGDAAAVEKHRQAAEFHEAKAKVGTETTGVRVRRFVV